MSEVTDTGKGIWHASSATAAVVLAWLVPKCPLCVAAMLGAWGFSAALVGVLTPFVRPAVFAACAALLLATVWHVAFEWAVVSNSLKRRWARIGAARSGTKCACRDGSAQRY